VLGLAFAASLPGQEPTRPQPARPPLPVPPAPVPAIAAEAELLALEMALAPLAHTLPHAFDELGMALPHALAAADLELSHAAVARAAEELAMQHALEPLALTLPHALDEVGMALPHALHAAALRMDAMARAMPQAFAASDDFADFAATAPESWAPQDPADSLYRMARRALNDGDYARAAQLFSRIHEDARYRGSEYRAVSYYYEALARTRIGGRSELQEAKAALDAMRRAHASAWSEQRDAVSLLTRVDAELARLGDATAAAAVQARGNAARRDPCTDANMGTKVEALSALMQMDAANALPILEEVLANRSMDACAVDLRRRALFLISQKRTDRTAAIMLGAARNDPSTDVQEQAVFWLSQVDTPEAMAALDSILRHSPSQKVQQQAVFAIAQHRSPRAAQLLRELVTRSDLAADVRGHAIFFMGQQSDPESARFLRELYPRLNDDELKGRVLFSVSQRQGQEHADWLLARALDRNEDMELRKQALFLAGQQKTLPLARLRELYEGAAGDELRQQVLFVISQRAQEPEAVDLLISIARTEQDPAVRKQAIFWLGQSKDPRAAAVLLELIKG